MTEQLAAGFGGESLTFDEGVTGDGGSQRLAPADALLHGLASGSDGHGVEPPAFFGGEGVPVAEGVGDVIG